MNGPTKIPHFEGLPVFTVEEIKALGGKKYTDAEINLIFDTKLSIGAAVETVRQDIGYNNHKPPERIALAQDYGSKIKDMLRGMGARTDEEKKI